MDFKKDPVLGILKEELALRTKDLKNLTPEEESKILSLKTEQRKSIAQMDRAAKESYLSAVPHVSSQGLKSHEKFLKFTKYLSDINRKD